MKKLLLTLVLLVGMFFGLFAQKLTYQAVVRDNNQQLVVNTAVKATVTIDFTGDQADYDTTITDVSTNIHGLLSFEFGGKTLNGRNWEGATIAVKVVKANDESIVYVNEVPRPVSAVPYALSVDGQSIQNYLTEHHYVDLDKLEDTLGAYPTTAVMDARHYLTSDSTVIKTMQGNITTNANSIDNLILHTAKNAIRDSVAGQIHDSISNIAAKAHTHDNKALLDNYTQTEANLADAVAKRHEHANAAVLAATQAPYTKADSIKLKGIADSAEVNVQSDWNQTTTTADDYIKNKPTIPTTVAELSDAGNYVKNADLTNLLNAINAKMDSLAHLVDSLAKLPHGGGEVADGQPCPGAAKVTDYDNNEYNTVKIGNQCWMKENLRTKTHTYGQVWTKTGADSAIYGRYYDWQAAMQIDVANDQSYTAGDKHRGICPEGWHVPSDAEWTQLTTYVKSVPEYVCDDCSGTNDEWNTYCIAKALSQPTGWSSNTGTGCNAGNTGDKANSTGFSAVPAGSCSGGNFSVFGDRAYFWSATQSGVSSAWYRCLNSNASIVYRDNANRGLGFSVRCLCDAEAGGGDTPGGDEPTPCTPTSSTHNIEISISELPYTFGDTTFQTGTTAGTYTLHRTNVGGCDSTITINLSFFTCGTDKVMDVDNNEYNTVAIGNQCWMKENMKTTRYANNTAVNNKKMFNPSNNQDNVAIYGKLYTWSAATRDSSTTYPAEGQVKVQGICPTGWHVPSKAEFGTLTNYVKDKTDCKCGTGIANALSSPTGWNNRNNSGCNAGDNSTTRNKTDFSAVPPGYFYVGIGTSGYDEFGDCAYFWSATQSASNEAYSLYLTKNSVLANDSNDGKGWGFSVRCLKD